MTRETLQVRMCVCVRAPVYVSKVLLMSQEGPSPSHSVEHQRVLLSRLSQLSEITLQPRGVLQSDVLHPLNRAHRALQR